MHEALQYSIVEASGHLAEFLQLMSSVNHGPPLFSVRLVYNRSKQTSTSLWIDGRSLQCWKLLCFVDHRRFSTPHRGLGSSRCNQQARPVNHNSQLTTHNPPDWRPSRAELRQSNVDFYARHREHALNPDTFGHGANGKMSGCTIIPDSAVREILIGQGRDETLIFMEDVRRCLTDYSLSKEREYQPGANVVVRPTGQKTLWRAFTSPTNAGCKIIVDPAADASGKKPPLHGVLVLTDNKGLQTGVINAEEVTGYRTSMASMIPFMARKRVQKVVVFGAGKQALWHTRLALVLRGEEIESVTVVNRSEGTAEALLRKVRADNEERWKANVQFSGLYPSHPDYESRLEELLGSADIVFCTVPSTEPLFPGKYILQRDLNDDWPLITAIGSWQPNMVELDPQLVKHAVDSPQCQHVLLVDDRIGCADHAGEVVQCGLRAEQMVEVGEVLGTTQEQASSGSNGGASDAFQEWLRMGLVVYKSVGVSVTDLTSGQRLLQLAKEKGLGTTVPDF